MEICKILSQRIVDVCSEKNIPIEKLSSLSKVGECTIKNIINEKTKNPEIITIAKICYALNISLQDFFDYEKFDLVNKNEIKKNY